MQNPKLITVTGVVHNMSEIFKSKKAIETINRLSQVTLVNSKFYSEMALCVS